MSNAIRSATLISLLAMSISPAAAFEMRTSTWAGNTVTLTLAAAAGRTYRIERSATLAGNSWTTVQTIGPLITDQTVTPAVTLPPGTVRQFLRVSVP